MSRNAGLDDAVERVLAMVQMEEEDMSLVDAVDAVERALAMVQAEENMNFVDEAAVKVPGQVTVVYLNLAGEISVSR